MLSPSLNLDALWAACTTGPAPIVSPDYSLEAKLGVFAAVLGRLGHTVGHAEVWLHLTFMPLVPGGTTKPTKMSSVRGESNVLSASRAIPVLAVNGALWHPESGWGVSALARHRVMTEEDFKRRDHPFQAWVKDVKEAMGPFTSSEWKKWQPSPAQAKALEQAAAQPFELPAPEAASPLLLRAITQDIFKNMIYTLEDHLPKTVDVLRFMAKTVGLALSCKLIAQPSASAVPGGPVQERYAVEFWAGSGKRARLVERWDAGAPGLEYWTSAPRPVPLELTASPRVGRDLAAATRKWLGDHPEVVAQLRAWKMEKLMDAKTPVAAPTAPRRPRM